MRRTMRDQIAALNRRDPYLVRLSSGHEFKARIVDVADDCARFVEGSCVRLIRLESIEEVQWHEVPRAQEVAATTQGD
jgi:hypothetical protein